MDMGEAVSGAIRQSDFGTEYQKPTRLLGRRPGLHHHIFEGWPAFDDNDKYSGPLPKFEGTSERLIGRQRSGFMTTDTAAWPEKLCNRIARLTVEAVRSTTPAEALTQGAEGGSCADSSVIVVEGPPQVYLPRRRKIT